MFFMLNKVSTSLINFDEILETLSLGAGIDNKVNWNTKSEPWLRN